MKPKNILVNKQNLIPKIIDFGLSIVIDGKTLKTLSPGNTPRLY